MSCRWRRGCSAPPSPPGWRASTSSTPIFDIEIDRAQGLHSFPARFGVPRGVLGRPRAARRDASRCSPGPALELDAGVFYWLGVGAVAALLAYEHAIVSPGDLRRLNTAFFTLNGVISIVFFCFVLADVAT